MSIQFNFFGIGSDQRLIADTVLRSLPGVVALPESGARGGLAPNPVEGPEDLEIRGSDIVALVMPAALASVATRETPTGMRIDFRSSPAVEYSPSTALDSETVRVGRLAYFSDQDSQMKSAVLALFRSLKKHPRRGPGLCADRLGDAVEAST